MAKTKENENLQEQENEIEAQAQEQPQEQAKEKMVKLRLPITKELQNDVFVRVNHRTWLIQRGVTVEVPECVMEVLEHAEQATYDGLQYQAAHMQKVD